MDHRCLYGHRVPDKFGFAVQQRICPTCGAPTVSTEGYRLARKLSLELETEPIDAFNIVRVIESDWVIDKRPEPAPDGTAPEDDQRVIDLEADKPTAASQQVTTGQA